MEYIDYINEKEYPTNPKRDPRGINVVERIGKCDAIKRALPDVEDDHVSVTSLKNYIRDLEEEVFSLKNYKVVTEMKELFSKGGEVIVKEDADFETAVVIDKDVNLVLAGKTISVKEDVDGSGVFHVTSGTLTIDGEGIIDGVGKNDYNMAIWADGGNVIINGGTFTNEGATADVDPAHFDLIYTKNGATVEINGGFFRCATPKWTLNKNDKTDSTIIVKGGTFVDYDPSNSETENPVESFVAEGYKVVVEPQENGEVWYTVVAE